MDRRAFLNNLSTAAAASIAAATTLPAKADALEDAMSAEIDKRRMKPPGLCNLDGKSEFDPSDKRPFLQHDEPLLPKMPDAPTLVDFFNLRFAPASHILQSARLAMLNGENEKVILACLLHDTCAFRLINTDHGYWGAQLVRPYVDEEVSWAIEKHQALRFFADDDFDYAYPDAYIRFFGVDYEPPPYIVKENDDAKKHKWYATARKITVNDLYSFEEDVDVQIEDFTDIIGRNFRQPKDGLGFDGSPTAHMWRSFIWPNNYL
jgi:hypothetical protein